ncbi:FGGY-family carbohydrate kinase [Lactobacillus sp. ESL0684]|uniref:xylulokinase n=1 Tax=unclassified Lactobacillus TaxID=2620435 RepID=UPI0023F89BC1|nr:MULTISPECIES: FGGY-family carbohydrate kinase [unclassified Lactobacillus]WEV40052.1 FGGY-family carbohydrate kinase [Lactobacillus sp. ESL0681]WEV43408.1 FGGY-family carbohydrate kinase [Lactobacillus sp. ESL0684]
MNITETAELIQSGKTALGIEFGSTQIKAVLIDDSFKPIATGTFQWENSLKDGIWSYTDDEIWTGLRQSYAQLAADVNGKYHVKLKKIGAIGISAMMHGYLVFDQDDQLLVPFRTWRNTTTADAAAELTELFNFNIPLRWSVAHLYHAILQDEEHVKDIAYMTTLAGYVHWQLSGEKNIGVGDASGMFPVDASAHFDSEKIEQFNLLPAVKKYSWQIEDILPEVLTAGQVAGHLTAKGAKLLDPTGTLEPGSIMAPPEGDAGTGMISTNSVRVRTGNISVGTSEFSMVVLDQALQKVHQDIDVVATPAGLPVAMVHVNNCSSDINAWSDIFKEFAERLGKNLSPEELYSTLFLATTKSDPDAGKIVNYGYFSGEPVTKTAEGRPMLVRTPNSHFNLGNFMLAQLYSAYAPLKIGMDVLTKEENVKTDVMIAQGGLFKTPVVGQQTLANVLDLPISVMVNASVGGPWGMAVLAQYSESTTTKNLADFLDSEVFINSETMTLSPEADGVKGANSYLERYQKALKLENQADILEDEVN